MIGGRCRRVVWADPLVQRWTLAWLWLLWALLCCLLSMSAVDGGLALAVRDLPGPVVEWFGRVTVAGLGQWYLWPSGLGAVVLAVASMVTGDAARARACRRLAWALAFVFVAVALSGLITDLIKVMVGRGRPKLLAAGGFYGFAPFTFRGAPYQSFPSGHATTVAALAAAVGFLLPRLCAPLVLFAVIIAASRVIVEAHYLGDVIGGGAIGWFVTWAVREGFARHRVLFGHGPDGRVVPVPGHGVRGRRPRRGAGAAPLLLLLLLLLLLPVFLAACAGDALTRREAATSLVLQAGMQSVRFDAGRFVLVGGLKGAGSGQPVLVVYLEGDGLAFVSRTQLSRDPTPRHPVGLELAAADPSPAVLYLGRPCQYVTPSEERDCGPQYWSSHRFAPEVIDAVNRAIDQALGLVGAGRVVLIGYSGGGAVAALATARRSDVAAWATVAAPLDHAAWTRWHEVSPLAGSLNPIDEAPRLAGLPQVHFVGAEDDVVPAGIVRGFLEREGPDPGNRLVVVPGVDHYCCWAGRWPDLRRLIPSGALPLDPDSIRGVAPGPRQGVTPWNPGPF